jgi:hypothetical protein
VALCGIMGEMSVRLAFGVTTGPGVRAWLPTPGDDPIPADGRAGAHPPGSPIAVGPADADPRAVREALARLTALVTDAGETAAGAGVDLGGGFVSARLAGARGDRRDAVLDAMRVLGSDRLGDRTAVLVALFGLSATKRVGAAANAAILDGRWSAVRLASAVSDLLGPEQVERVLDLRAPEGVDPFPDGAASTLADHLVGVLARYPRPRRLTLIESLWRHVCDRQLNRLRLDRLAAKQVRADRIERLRERHRDHFERSIMQYLRWALGREPRLADVARWQPPKWLAATELRALLHDAIAATALLRLARTVSDEGLEEAARRHHGELVAADACLTDDERTAATHRPQGGYSHPARPGRYVHDLVQPLGPGQAFTAKTETYVRERVGMARNYGVVVLEAVTQYIRSRDDEPLRNCQDRCKPWHAEHLTRWRGATGFVRAPSGWEQPPLADEHADSPTQTLARRLAAAPDADPVTLERPHDLLWLADLGDALAPFYGHETAAVRYEPSAPLVNHNPPELGPSRPRTDTVALAVAGVAQLVAFGATPPERCGSWAELVEGVDKGAVVAETSVGLFPIPAELSDMDGRMLPGTGLVIELGRGPRQLAGWSGYMGNCIGQPWYTEVATRGHGVLMALRDGQGRIVANLHIQQRPRGWTVEELRARFNDSVDPTLEEQVRAWVSGLARPEPPPPAPPVPPVRTRGGSRRRPTGLPTELVHALTECVRRELASAGPARRTYVALAGGGTTDYEPEAAVIALKRASRARHVELLGKAIDAGMGASVLWRATGFRPLAAAVGRLGPGLRDHERLGALADGTPLPRSLRTLVRRPEIAPAHALDVAARAVRMAMGELVGGEALPRAVARQPNPVLVCAMTIAATCSGVGVRLVAPGITSVPGFPATDLLDENGPWQRALPAAAELGAPVELFGRRVAEQGLTVPSAMLGKGGWPALWRRAHR